MPMIRYQIRNEYGLADPELYGAASRDDPEALLEGVAMAGLVGVLRQFGDLAEFAAEMFHELHEEVMVTVGRGHGLMLRVQQIEAEFSSVEKAFLSQTSHSNLAYTKGIDWHANLRIDRNLITRGDMPRFILDSYEECRGPPQLFMLDKFDVAGDGACLKRYTDPSFFKIELASSGTMDSELQRERKTRKIMKKVSHWRDGEVDESSLLHHVNSNSQPKNSEHVPDKKPTRRVRLKSRCLNSMDTSSRRSYMESLLEVHSPEQKVPLESYPPIREKPILPPTKQITELPSNELENQKINEDFPETLSEKKEMLTNSESDTEGSFNSYKSDAAEKSNSALQEVYRHKLSADTECSAEGFSDSYASDDIGKELENYMDALNTMESEIETDSESKVKSDPGLFNVMLSGNNKGQQELVAQFSKPGIVENSIAPLGFEMSNKGMSSFSNSNNLGNLADTQPPERYMINLDVPVIKIDDFNEGQLMTSDSNEQSSCFAKIDHKVAEHLVEDLPCTTEISMAKRFDDSPFWSRYVPAKVHPAEHVEELGGAHDMLDLITQKQDAGILEKVPAGFDEACSSGSISPSTSDFHPDISSIVAKPGGLAAEAKNSMLPDEIASPASVIGTHTVVENLNGSPSGRGDAPEETHPTGDDEELDPFQTQKGITILQEGPAGYVEDSPPSFSGHTGEPHDSIEQDADASSDGSISSTSPCISPATSHISVRPSVSAAKIENFVVPSKELACSQSAVDLENVYDIIKTEIRLSNVLPCELEPLSDVEEPRETGNVESAEFPPLCLEKETFPDHMQLQSNCEVIDGPAPVGDDFRLPFGSKVSSLHEDALQIEQPIECVDTLSKCVPAESVVDCLDASSRYSSELSCFHIQSQENCVPGDADLDQHESLSPKVENLQVSASAVPSFEFSNLDLSKSSDAKSSNAIHHTMAAELAETDLGTSIDDEDQIYSLENEQDFSSRASSQCTHEPAVDEPDVIASCQEGKHPEAADLRFEMSRSVEQENAQKCSVELDDNPSEIGLEDSNESNTGIHRQLEPETSIRSDCGSEHSVSSSAPNVSAAGLEISESCLKFSEPQISDPFLSFQLQDVKQDVQETPPLPPLPPLEWRMGKLRLGSLTSHRNLVHPLIGTNPFTEFPTIEEMVEPANMFAPLQPREDEISRPLHELQGEKIQPLEDKRPQVGQFLSVLQTSQHVSIETDMLRFASPLLVEPAAEDESIVKNQHSYGFYGGGNLQHLNFSAPFTTSGPEMPQHGFISSWEANPSILDDGTVSTMEDEKPNGKLRSIRNRPRHPLIEAVAAHDKSKLRKISEMAQPSARPEVDERDSLLEQIRNKSFNLKPAAGTKPNIKGPPTNLRVAAILEKANAIRQACVGSDEDDDGDNWSDS